MCENAKSLLLFDEVGCEKRVLSCSLLLFVLSWRVLCVYLCADENESHSKKRIQGSNKFPQSPLHFARKRERRPHVEKKRNANQQNQITSSTEAPLNSRRTQGTRGLSRGIPSYATPRLTPYNTNESSSFAVSIIIPTPFPVCTYSPSPFLGPYALPQ